MRSATFLMLAFAAGCSREMPTYDQVVELGREDSRAAQVTEWRTKVLDQFWPAHMDGVVQPCQHLLKVGERVAPRFVIDAGAPSRPHPVRDESQTALSRCLAQQLRELDWPTPPDDLRFVPIEIALLKHPEPAKPAA
jgi:hypothetical protein